MSDPFIGEIRLFPYGYAPYGWDYCQGQTYSVSQNPALASVLAFNFGGDYRTYFCLPNLASVGIIGAGQSPTNIYNYEFAKIVGADTVTLTSSQAPSHTHTLNALLPSTPSDTTCTNIPSNAANLTRATVKGSPPVPTKLYQTAVTSGATLAPNTMSYSSTTSPQPHDNHQPYLVMHYCIAIDGIYPVHP